MMGIGVVMHATVMLIVAYFIWFAASKASGLVRAIGMLLALWVLVLTGISAAWMGSAASGNGPPFMQMMREHIGGWMHGHESATQPGAAPTPTPAPNPIAQPSPSKATPPKR